MAAYDPDNLRLIVVFLYFNEVYIAMIKHKRDEYPVIDQKTETCISSFRVNRDSVDDITEIRLALIRCIFDLYPNNFLLSDDIMAWNLSPKESVDQVRQNIMDRLTPNPLFNGSIVFRPPNDEALSLIGVNLERSLTKWGFHATVKASVFSLKCKVLNFISKFFMNKILAGKETEYFYRGKSDVHLINTVDNLSFFNVIFLMGDFKRHSFRASYHAKLQQLELPQILLKNLEDYCPSNKYIYLPLGFS